MVTTGVQKKMTRGGKREGSGRPRKPEELKAKRYNLRLYEWEVQPVKDFIKKLRAK
jgi:hypothetical protein